MVAKADNKDHSGDCKKTLGDIALHTFLFLLLLILLFFPYCLLKLAVKEHLLIHTLAK